MSSICAKSRYLLASRSGSAAGSLLPELGVLEVGTGNRKDAVLVWEAITATWFPCEKLRCAFKRRRMWESAVWRGSSSWSVDQANGLVSRITTRREGLSSNYAEESSMRTC